MTTLSNVKTGADALAAYKPAATSASAPPAAPAPAPAPAVAADDNGVKLIDDKTATVVDALGRTIKVRRLSAIDRMRISRAVGGENSGNDRYVGYCTLAAAVVEIDGIAAPSMTALQMEATVQRLDDDGLVAVANALKALTPGLDAETVANL